MNERLPNSAQTRDLSRHIVISRITMENRVLDAITAEPLSEQERQWRRMISPPGETPGPLFNETEPAENAARYAGDLAFARFTVEG